MSIKGKIIQKYLVRTGIGLVVAVLLLCVIELKKEQMAKALYTGTLYQATAQGRWLQYGRYEPAGLYRKTLDKIPILHYLRRNTGTASEPEEKEQESEETEVKDKEIREGNLLVRYAYGTVQPLENGIEAGTESTEEFIQMVPVQSVLSVVKEQYQWKDTAAQAKFLKNYYIADVSVGDVSAVINGETLLTKDMSLDRITEEPQILIYHTHGTERYQDSRPGTEADTVVGMGDILCEALTAKGFSVIHDRTTYDYINGKNNRDYAYTTARPEIEALLQEYPSVEVILDIHRDSGAARRTVIDGKDTAQIMLFNGLCRNASGPIKNLANPYLEDTLAFSLQLNLLGRERYPGLMYKIYLKNYRYNMHFREHCMLVELGTEQNTVEEAQNGVRYLAELLYELLTENIEN